MANTGERGGGLRINDIKNPPIQSKYPHIQNETNVERGRGSHDNEQTHEYERKACTLSVNTIYL